MAKNRKFYSEGREVSLIEGLKPMERCGGVTLLPQMVFTGKLKIREYPSWDSNQVRLSNHYFYSIEMLKLIPQKK